MFAISKFLSIEKSPYFAHNCILAISSKSYNPKKLSGQPVNYFCHKNLKISKVKNLFFAPNNPKMNLFMTQWYIN